MKKFYRTAETSTWGSIISDKSTALSIMSDLKEKYPSSKHWIERNTDYDATVFINFENEADEAEFILRMSN